MALETDLLIDRRRLKRQAGFWRAAFVLGALLVAGLAWGGHLSKDLLGGDYVARLPLKGTITDDERLLRRLHEAREDDRIRAVLVVIDSPGGTVAGGEGLHRAISALRAAGKPVVAVMGATAASAGYMVALPAERIFAREATLTGSIGVILQSFEVSDLMGRLGLRAESLTSGPLKDQPSPFRPLTEEGRAALSAVVRDMYDQFVAMVVAGRRMPEAEVRRLADGRVMTGRQAVAAGLVDAIGGETEARRWLAETHAVPEALDTRDIDPRSTAERAFSLASSRFWQAGMSALRAEGWWPGTMLPR
ncbi:signal peptide peptidase SppA [Roseococcus sp. YIM B11640]|uniref:signal peptide peptidase SppA n=1 Tax=Roseococcus sp. YIM B11640 TaxID=3133973 RepID=UPI003C7CAA6A